MYSQYNKYQQYQQQQPSVQTGMVWNGTSWVSSNPVRSTSSTSTIVIPSNPVQTFTQYYHGWMERHKILAERIQRINLTTTTKEEQQQEQRQHLELEQQWAKYYADESSRAAHYFYQNPNHHDTTISSLPFSLPPAPPSPTAENQNPKQQQPQKPKQQQQQQNNHSSSSLVVHSQRNSSSSSSSRSHANSIPNNSNNNKSQNNTNKNTNNISNNNNNNNKEGSLTRYLKRNLELCQTEDEKKYVQTQIEKKIATAIQQGTLQSRDWDREPMIIIQTQNNNINNINTTNTNIERALPTQKSTNFYGNYESNNSSNSNSKNKNVDPKNNYYGPAAVTATSTNNNNTVDTNYHYQYGNNASSHNNKKRKSSINDNNNNSASYYGPASSNNNSAENYNNYNNPSSSCSFSSSPPPTAAASSSFPVSFALSQNTNTNHYTNKKRHKKRQWDTNSSCTTTTNSVGEQDDDDQQEDFLALPGGGTTTSNKSRRPTYKKLRTNKLVVSKDIMMIDDGMDISHEALAKRANRFSSHHHHHHNPQTKSLSLQLVAASSSNHDRYMGKGLIGGTNTQLDETDYEQMTVKGTSTILEKEYLRLTAPPRPERVRPLPILKRHLNNIKMEYYYCLPLEENEDDENKNEDGNLGENNEMKEEMIQKVLYERERTPQAQWNIRGEKQKSDSGQQTTTTTTSSSSGRRIARRQHDYLWFCSQLKAVRQDCTVQRIQGTFAVDVYETHARIALQEGDLNEYNQCQTQLKELYKSAPCSATDPTTSKDNVTLQQEDQDVVAGKDSSSAEALSSSSSSSSSWQNEDEFIAYRLLYYVYLSTNEKYSGGSSDMFQIMLSLSPTQKKHPGISHALQVREAVACSDYYCFFRLLSRSSSHCPNLGIFLIDLLVPTMRMRGLRRIAKAYRPSIEVTVCLEQLGFVQEQRIVNDDGNFGNGDDGNDDSEDKVKNDFQHGKDWMVSCGAVLTDEGLFLTKDSEIHEPVAAKKNSLI